jgi:hypothetical protein
MASSEQKGVDFERKEVVSRPLDATEEPPDDMDGAESESSDGKRTGKSQQSLVSLTDLETTFPQGMTKFPTCFLCQQTANSVSPLKGGGLRPWLNYKRVVKKKSKQATAKIPKGKLCAICRTVYKTIGYDHKYGIKNAFAKYKEAISNPSEGTKTHKVFLSAVVDWIKQYNRQDAFDSHGNSKTRMSLKSRKQMLDRHRLIETSKSNTLRVHGREKVFIEQKYWDATKDGGDYDKSKEIELVIDGVTKAGCYKWTGRQGVHKVEELDDTTMTEKTVEQEGEGDLNDQAMANTAEALNLQRRAAIRERDDHAVDGDILDLSQLFATVAGGGKPSNADGKEAEGVPKKKEADDEATEDELGSDEEEVASSENDDDGDADERFSLFFGKKQKLGSSTGPSTPSKNKKSSPASSSQKKSHGPDSAAKVGKRSSGGTGSEETSPPAKAPRKLDITRLDGRGERLAQAVDECLSEEGAQIEGVSFDEEQLGTALFGTALADFNSSVTKKGVKFEATRKKIGDMIKRVEASANKESLGRRHEQLLLLKEKSDVASQFVQFILKPCRDINSALEAIKATKQ